MRADKPIFEASLTGSFGQIKARDDGSRGAYKLLNNVLVMLLYHYVFLL